MVERNRLLLIFVDSYPLSTFSRQSDVYALFRCVRRSVCFEALVRLVATLHGAIIKVTMAAVKVAKWRLLLSSSF